MNSNTLSDTEIFNVIDREISQGDLEPACQKLADQESQGNYDLMISRYFLARIEMLKNHQNLSKGQGQKIQDSSRSIALEERKIATANNHLVRYRVNQASQEDLEVNKKNLDTLINISGNIILILSSISIISAIMILLGHTIHTLPYLVIIGSVIVSLALPYLLSKISIKSCMVSYQTTLAALCIFTCMGSAATGIYLMKMNPSNYHPEEQIAGQVLQSQDQEIALKPAKSGNSVVTNP